MCTPSATVARRLLGRALPLLLLLAALTARPAAAQTAPADTARLSYSEETMTEPLAPPGSLSQGYSQLTRLQVEETRLWKIGMTNLVFGSHWGPHLAYERKLSPAWSVLAEISPAYLRYRPDSVSASRPALAVSSQVAGRYYYNLDRRIRKGRSASNFSANYISAAISTGVGRRSDRTSFYEYRDASQGFRAAAAVLYGIQRRLGPYGFVDFNVGLATKLVRDKTPYGPEEFAPMPPGVPRIVLRLRIGVALGQ